MFKTVTAKLAGMRKEQRFVVYPRKSATDLILVQSERAIGQFDPKTGKGLLNYKGSNAKYFYHLQMVGVEVFTFPPEFVKACLESESKAGDEMGGVVIGSDQPEN